MRRRFNCSAWRPIRNGPMGRGRVRASGGRQPPVFRASGGRQPPVFRASGGRQPPVFRANAGVSPLSSGRTRASAPCLQGERGRQPPVFRANAGVSPLSSGRTRASAPCLQGERGRQPPVFRANAGVSPLSSGRTGGVSPAVPDARARPTWVTATAIEAGESISAMISRTCESDPCARTCEKWLQITRRSRASGSGQRPLGQSSSQSRDLELPRAVTRAEVKLDTTGKRELYQPFHEVMHLPWDEAILSVRDAERAIETFATHRLKSLVSELRNRGFEVGSVAIVGAPERNLKGIGSPHIRAHAAEGVLFRHVWQVAARAIDLHAEAFPEKDIETLAADRLRLSVQALERGSQISVKPWGADGARMKRPPPWQRGWLSASGMKCSLPITTAAVETQSHH